MTFCLFWVARMTHTAVRWFRLPLILIAAMALQAARDVALFTLLYGAGLRIAEALALNLAEAPLPGRDVRGGGR